MSSGRIVNAAAAGNIAGLDHELLELVSGLICLLRQGRILSGFAGAFE